MNHDDRTVDVAIDNGASLYDQKAIRSDVAFQMT